MIYVSMTTSDYPFKMPLLMLPLKKHMLLSRKKTEMKNERQYELGPFQPHMPHSTI